MSESMNGPRFDRFSEIAILYSEAVGKADRRIFLTPDMVIETHGQSLPPRGEVRAGLQVPLGTLVAGKIVDPVNEGDFVKLLTAMQDFSVKSVLAQAGVSVQVDIPTGQLTTERPLEVENGNYKVPIIITNENHILTLKLPRSSQLPLLRLVVPSTFLTGDELIQAVSEMKLPEYQYLVADGPDLPAGQAMAQEEREALVGISIPIVRYARFIGRKTVDLEELAAAGASDRKKLDKMLGLVWDGKQEETTGFSPELIIGETPAVEMGPYCGKILVGVDTLPRPSMLSIHSSSKVIDSGFTGNVRVEEIGYGILGGDRTLPASIKMQLFR